MGRWRWCEGSIGTATERTSLNRHLHPEEAGHGWWMVVMVMRVSPSSTFTPIVVTTIVNMLQGGILFIVNSELPSDCAAGRDQFSRSSLPQIRFESLVTGFPLPGWGLTSAASHRHLSSTSVWPKPHSCWSSSSCGNRIEDDWGRYKSYLQDVSMCCKN